MLLETGLRLVLLLIILRRVGDQLVCVAIVVHLVLGGLRRCCLVVV